MKVASKSTAVRVSIWVAAAIGIFLLALVALAIMLPSAQTAPVEPVAQSTSAGPSESATAAEAPPTPAPKPEPVAAVVAVVRATVVRVVDGDTAVFRLDDGTEEKVRFIGVDTPESTNSIEIYGKEASAYTTKALPVGKRVFLERDVEERDRYGRLLAYVWLANPTALTEVEIRDKMFNAKLALDGYAQQMTIQPNSKYAEYFTKFVAEARDADKGLWDPALVAATASPKPAPAPAGVAPSPNPASNYIGNGNTKKFHVPACSSVGQMNSSNKVALNSRDEAVAQGYVPCKRCNP